MSLTLKQFYQYGTKKVEYNLIRSKRRKTSEIIVDEKITVRVPFDKPIYEIEKLLSSKIRWILEKQNQHIKKEEIVQIVNSTFLHNSTLPYLGPSYFHILSLNFLEFLISLLSFFLMVNVNNV